MKINYKSPFLQSITVLASGSVISQIITVLSAPFLTRLFTPENIGVYTYILSLLFLFMPIINGRYDMSIVNEEKEERVYSLINLSFLICLIASTLISIGCAYYFKYISRTYFSYTYLSIFIFLLLITSGIINILNSYNNRNKEYKLMSSIYIFRTAAQNIGSILGGIFNMGLLGLLIPYFLGQIVGLKKQSQSLRSKLSELKKVKRKDMWEVLKIHYKQPLYSSPAIFANNFSYSSITFFIGILFGMSEVGFYSISVRILGLPLSVISGNVSRVFFEGASREHERTGQFNQSFLRTTKFLVALAVPMVLAMIYIVPPLIRLFFGEEWVEAGVYIKVLALMFGLRFIVSSLTPGLLVAKKQNYELLLQTLFVACSVISFMVVKGRGLSIIDYLIAINISFSIVYIIYFFTIYNFSKSNAKGFVYP